MRLGSIGLLTDGVLGWFLEDDPTQLHPIHGAVGAAVGAAEAGGGGATLLGEPLVWLTPGQTRKVVVLAVPAADLTVVSGLLPQKRLDMVREWTDGPLRRLTPTFAFDAIIRDPAAVALPVPSGVRGTWSWFQRPAPGSPWSATEISADPPSAQPGTRVLAQDGYLRVALIEDPPFETVSFQVECITRGGPTGSIQFIGGTSADGSR